MTPWSNSIASPGSHTARQAAKLCRTTQQGVGHDLVKTALETNAQGISNPRKTHGIASFISHSARQAAKLCTRLPTPNTHLS